MSGDFAIIFPAGEVSPDALSDLIKRVANRSAALDPLSAYGDVVECGLEVHPRAKPWLELLKGGRKVTQRDLWLFVRSRLADFCPVVARDGTELGSYGPMLAAELQKLEVSKGSKLSTQLDGLGNVVFSAGEAKTEVSGKLPPSFEIEIPLLRDISLNGKEPTYRLEIFLALHLEGDGEVKRPLFSLEAPGLDLASVKAQEDALQCLREILAGPEPQGYLVGLGSVRIEVVPVVRSE